MIKKMSFEIIQGEWCDKFQKKKSPIYQFLKFSGIIIVNFLYVILSMKSPCLWAIVWDHLNLKSSSEYNNNYASWGLIFVWRESELSLLKNICNFLNELFKFPITTINELVL
jgi:hypothetical protein